MGLRDDTTFLTKAGHVGVVYRVCGVDYEGLSHAQRQTIGHRFESAVRLLDDHCRVYQYLLKRTIAPIVGALCPQPIAHEAIQRRAAYLKARYSLTEGGQAEAASSHEHVCSASARTACSRRVS